MPVHSRDPIDDVTRELITKCAGPKPEWRTLDKMSSTIMRAKGAIKQALERVGDAVKMRVGDMDAEYLIQGDREELLVRAGLMTAHRSAADSSTVIASLRAQLAEANAENEKLRAENADLRAKNERLRAEIERLKKAPLEEVEVIAAKLAAKGEMKPTVDNVVVAVGGQAFKIERAEPTVFGEKKIA
jgi:predicted nuclease with TOPRIM domain